MTTALAGLRVLVPESREIELFAAMLERAGAVVRRCPLVAILDPAEPGPAEAWLRRLVDGRFDDVVFYTGEGVVRLGAVATRLGVADDFRAALAGSRLVVRGPKPTRAIRTLGLSPGLSADPATTAGLVAVLAPQDLRGRTVGVQGYPEQPPDFIAFLEEKGAVADLVVPYRYAADGEDERVAEAIRGMAAGAVDVVAFTSTPQVRRLDEVAARRGMGDVLAAARARTAVAAVGPVTAEALERSGWNDVRSAGGTFHLKPLVAVLATMAAEAGAQGAATANAADSGAAEDGPTKTA